MVIEVRNVAYGLQSTESMETYGIWHNLFIGLGAVESPFGIERLDDNGFQHARAIDPAVKFTSKHYYDMLKGAYFDLVAKYPLTVAKIYVAKFAKAMKNGIWYLLLPEC
jgi:hypothetical protein